MGRLRIKAKRFMEFVVRQGQKENDPLIETIRDNMRKAKEIKAKEQTRQPWRR